MVRVLFVSAVPDLRGGAEQVLLDMLGNPKVEPVLALPGHGPLESYAVRFNAPVIYFSPGYVLNVHRPVKIAAALRAIPDALRSAGQLRRAARQYGCGIIHANGLKVHVLTTLATLFSRDLRSVVHLHDIPYSPVERLLWRLLGKVSDRVVVVSRPCWPGSVLPSNVRIIPNGLAASTGTPSVPTATPAVAAHRSEVFRLGFVGRFHRHKGLLLLVDWLAAARDAGLEFECLFRGGSDPDDPAYWESVQDKLQQVKLLDRIHIDGWRTGKSVYEGLDAIVVPSDCPDPLPRVVLEAGAQGLPVIALPTGGIPSMIIDGHTGFLVSGTSGFVDVLGKLIGNPDLRDAVGSAAQRHIAAEFTLPRFYERFDALYGELAGHGDPAVVATPVATAPIVTGTPLQRGDPAARS
jgi:glycosyltransferase involved in cell wall biosynthesis